MPHLRRTTGPLLHRVCLASLLILLTCAPAVAAEELPSAQAIEARIQALEAMAEIDDATRTVAVEALREALRSIAERQTRLEQERDFERRRETAPGELSRLQAELESPVQPGLPQIAPGTPSEEIEKGLQAARAEEAERARVADALQGKPAAREARLKELPAAIAEARRLLTEAERAFEQAPPSTETKPPAQARRIRALARQESARAHVTALESEQRALEAEAGLHTARLRVAERARDVARQVARAWEQAWQARREAEGRAAEEAAAQARRDAEDADPTVRTLAERNLELTRATRRVTERAKHAAEARQKAQDELTTIDRRESEVRKRIAAVGLTEAIGYLLRQHRARLPRMNSRRERLEERRAEIAELQLQRFENEEELERLSDNGVAASNGDGSGDDEPDVPGRLRKLRADRRGYLDTAVAEIEKAVVALVALDTTERQLLARAAAYATFIDERVLWIRSTDTLWSRGTSGLSGALGWLAAPQSWSGVGGAVVRHLRDSALRYIFLLLAYAAVILLGGRLARMADQPESLIEKATSFWPTLLRFLADALCALRIPAALWLVGDLLSDAGVTALQRALGDGLQSAAAFSLPLLALRRVLVKGGLARAHFGWSREAALCLRRPVLATILIGTPAAGLVSLFAGAPNDEHNASLGRIALVVLLVVAAVFLERVLRPISGVLAVRDESEMTWLQRTRGLWYILGVGTPVVLAALAIFGYQFTAVELTGRLEQTVALVAGLVILQALVGRSLVVTRRRALRAEASPEPVVAESTAATPAATAGVGVVGASDATTPATVEEHIDAETIDTHTRQLLRTVTVLAAVLAGWWIWVDVLPALSMLREVELWTTSAQVTRDVVIEGVTTPTAVLEIVPVTLADLLFVLVVLVFTVLAARNIPGVLEVVLLKRVVAQPSSRYAIATVARHLIWIIGLVLILGRLGLGWSKVQWLVAALGVGLGFGLQEIFGNFISGLILLFERRIRLGDIVTVGDVSGQVTRIRVLATTVRNWERKEFIVPNKDLITGRLLNWTLSDDVNRLVVNAGVAYGTDTKRARELMLQVASRHPDVVADPPPITTFEQFGDNSLLLVLRAFIKNLDRRLVILTELHEGVAKAFAKSGIEISFPQRDLHLRTVPPGWSPSPETPPPASPPRG